VTEKNVEEMLRAKADAFRLRALQPKRLLRRARIRRARYAVSVALVTVAAVMASAIATHSPRSSRSSTSWIAAPSRRILSFQLSPATTKVRVTSRSPLRSSGSTPTACGRMA
jgi:hypothetical protein